MKTILIICSLVIAILIVVVGVSFGIIAPETTARVVASPHTSVIIKGLAKYHTERNDYPEALAALVPAFLAGDIDKYTRCITPRGQRWAINYKRIDAQTYELSFNHAFYDVDYRNGVVTGAHNSPFR